MTISNPFCVVSKEALEGLNLASKLHLADSSFHYDPETHMRNNGQWLVSNNLRQTEIAMITNIPSSHICATLDFHAHEHSCNAFLCCSHHHAFATKRVNRAWMLLDSLKSGPLDLNDFD
eukprot:1153289-Pelagomonas_calceolata.AAC.8